MKSNPFLLIILFFLDQQPTSLGNKPDIFRFGLEIINHPIQNSCNNSFVFSSPFRIWNDIKRYVSDFAPSSCSVVLIGNQRKPHKDCYSDSAISLGLIILIYPLSLVIRFA